MPFPFKPYRSTQSTQEVLARLRLKLVLGKTPPMFLWPRDRTFAERAKSFFLLHSLGVVVLSMPCCLSFRSISKSSGLNCSFACRCIEVIALRLALIGSEPVGGRTSG
jgi:hypothetical protein